ncbi:MAG: OmpA family protein [Alphaproteobacteria bacterium]|nr:OmpA family protein [Alphaproteobacteria bacterium]
MAGVVRSAVWMIALGSAPMAAAQEDIRFDATGPDAPPLVGDGPVTLWSADGMRRGETRFSGLFEGAGGLLELTNAAGEDLARGVTFASGLNLSGAWAPIDRFGLGATASAWTLAPGGRIAVGALRLDAPIRVVASDEDFALSVTPWVALPFGSASRAVASPGLSAGLVAAARIPLGPLEANANLGASARPGGDFPDFAGLQPTQRIGGPSVDFGAALGVRPGRFQADLELRGAWSVTAGSLVERDDVPDADLFSEVLVSAGSEITDRLSWKAGVGTGLSVGIGTSVGRGFLGLVWRDRPTREPEIVDRPDPDRAWTVAVMGEGSPLVGAIVLVGGEEAGRTGANGEVSLKGIDWKAGLAAEAPGFQRGVGAKPAKGTRVAIDLAPQAMPVPITVRSAGGDALAAALTATADGREPVSAGPDDLALQPGRWTLEIAVEGYGAQTRQLVVVPGVPPEPIEVVLQESQGEATLVHTVLDADGAPVAGATVLIDGLPVGTTGEDGTIQIAGLAEGEHVLAIQHPSYTATEQPVTLGSGKLDVQTPLARVPGTVKVVARDGGGEPVPDAVVRFAGPRRLAPMPLGSRGERTEVLGPGTWQLLVSSMQYGFQQRELVVPEDSWDLIEVDVVLQPSEGGAARLDVRVVDVDGKPVDDATVTLDGQAYGTTSTGGVLSLEGLNAGQRELAVGSEHHVEAAVTPVVLVDGLQEEVVTLAWRPGTVRVRARTPDGVIGDAQARFAGPERIAATDLGATGTAFFQVQPGDWSVLVTSPTYGIQQRELTVSDAPGSLHDVTVVLQTSEGGLANLGLSVSDPDGRSVDGARVFLDSIPLGQTTVGTLRAEQLAAGKRLLEVESPFFQPYSTSLDLRAGDTQHAVAMKWGPGAVRVKVRDNQGRAVKDGLVRLLGPTSVPPSPVDAKGERLFALGPGEWQALAISPTLGMTQVPVVVTDAPGLQVVVAEIRPIQAGLADVVVRVVDRAGRPVANASISVDGKQRGTTEGGGVLVVRNLVPGVVALDVTAPKHAKGAAEIEVLEGSQVRYLTLDALPGRLDVTVTDEAGHPVDAEVSLIGPEDWMPMSTGPDGVEQFVVAPGAWQVVATAKGLAAGRADATLEADGQASVALKLGASRVEVADTEVVLRDVVLFDFDAATLRADAAPLLDEVANTLLSNPEIIRVEVQGHSDNVGNLAYNLTLSQRRAESVKRALVDRGVAPEKLAARGYGAQRPVATNDSEAGRAANRRVEFEIRK